MSSLSRNDEGERVGEGSTRLEKQNRIALYLRRKTQTKEKSLATRHPSLCIKGVSETKALQSVVCRGLDCGSEREEIHRFCSLPSPPSVNSFAIAGRFWRHCSRHVCLRKKIFLPWLDVVRSTQNASAGKWALRNLKGLCADERSSLPKRYKRGHFLTCFPIPHQQLLSNFFSNNYQIKTTPRCSLKFSSLLP